MWSAQKAVEGSGQVVKFTIDAGANRLTFIDVLRLLSSDSSFRSFFVAQLSDIPFEAYRWETPAIVAANVGRDFECVFLDSPGLGSRPDPQPFAEHFHSPAGKGVVVFPNLGNDGTMIVPCPLTSDDAYGHLAAFVRRAPAEQSQLLWTTVADTTLTQISDKPLWLNCRSRRRVVACPPGFTTEILPLRCVQSCTTVLVVAPQK